MPSKRSRFRMFFSIFMGSVITLGMLFGMAAAGGNVQAATTMLMNEDWNAVTAWDAVGVAEINPAGQLHLKGTGDIGNVTRTDVSVPGTYTFETRIAISDFSASGVSCAFKVHDGVTRLMLRIESDGIYAFDSSGEWVKKKTITIDTNWHDYKAEVSNGYAQVYMDGTLQFSYLMHANATADTIALWSNGTSSDYAEYRVDYTKLYVDDTLGLTDHSNYRVFQRGLGANKNASISVSGTYTGTGVASVQARVLSKDTLTEVVEWTTIASSPTGGSYSGTLSVPQGGWYNLQVRTRDASNQVISTRNGKNKWGVGIVILTIGQSNMVGYGLTPYTTADDLVANFNKDGEWEHLVDPYSAGGPTNGISYSASNGGSMTPSIGNELVAAYNVPVAFIPTAKGGTALNGTGNNHWVVRNESNHADPSNLYGNSVARARAAGGVELIIMNQGEADATQLYSEATYMSAFTTLISHYREDLYSTIPIFTGQLGTRENTSATPTDASTSGIRSAQRNLDNGTNIFMAATQMDIPRRVANVHYTTPGYETIGIRVANAIKYYFGDSSYYRGPEIISAEFANLEKDEVNVKISHRGGTDFTPASGGITGFKVFNNGTEVTVNTAFRLNSDTIRLRLASPMTGTGTLRYLYGKNPDVSGMVKDNTSLHLPLENTTTAIPIAVNITKYEAENLLPAAASSGDTAEEKALSSASNGAGLEFKANAAGDYVTLNVNVAQAGTYKVKIQYRQVIATPISQLSINGVIQGQPIDLYSPTATFTEFDLGNVTISSAGNQQFKFQTTGQGAGTGWWFVIDYIWLRKL